MAVNIILYNLSMYDIDPLSQGQKNILMAIEGIFVFLYFYILASFTYFLSARKESVNSHCKYRKVLPAILVGLLFLAIMKSFLVMFSLLLPTQETGRHCEILETTYQGMTVAAVAFMYTFLWLRQYTFYREPSLKALVTPVLANLSKYTLILILVGIAAGGVGIAVTSSARKHPYIVEINSCVYTSETDSNSLVLYICHGAMTILQGLLVFLMYYILKKHQDDMLRYDVRSNSASSFHKLVRNCTIATCCGLLVNVITLILDTKLPFHLSQSVYLFMWDLSFAIHIGCLIFCFSSWKIMIFPWKKHLKTKNRYRNNNINTINLH